MGRRRTVAVACSCRARRSSSVMRRRRPPGPPPWPIPTTQSGRTRRGDAMPPSSCTAIILPPRDISFHRVAGVPLIQRTALSALRSGFDAVVALAPGDGRPVRSLFAGDQRTAVIPVVGGALDAAVTTERVAYIPSDCLVDARALAQVYAAECNGRPIA